MKSTELRIGNLILCEGLPVQLVSIGSWDCQFCYNGKITTIMNAPYQDLKGIELSPEWLLDFGLKTVTENGDGSDNYWSKEKDCSVDVSTYILTTKMDMIFHYRVHERVRVKHLLYVHQLQNLYFALTGNELEPKNQPA